MEIHPDLWQRYFDEFLLHKLRLGGLQEGTISLQIFHVFFSHLHEQETVLRVVSLHCNVHANHLEFARKANRLRPLNQLQQVCACLVTNENHCTLGTLVINFAGAKIGWSGNLECFLFGH